MPVAHDSDAPQPHREKLDCDLVGQLALVTRQLTPTELRQNQAAMQALDVEWDKLARMGTWDASEVCEYEAARKRALEQGRTAHFGRLFGFTSGKHSKLPPARRKYKGRVVFQGNMVKDAEGLMAVFAELGSSASLMSASKLLDAVAMLPGCAGEQSDAEQAYTQARFGHGEKHPVETWVRLPKERWPKEWHGKFRDPVVPLRLALYGRPLSGVFWERYCREALLSVGFTTVPGWESFRSQRPQAGPGCVR